MELRKKLSKKAKCLIWTAVYRIALVRQPSIIASFYTVEVNRSRVGEAQGYYPQIAANGCSDRGGTSL